MAIKLEDAVAVVQKRDPKWREKYESVANENGQDHPIMVEDENHGRLFLSAYGDPLKKSLRFLSITTMCFIVFSAKMHRKPCGKI